MTINTIPFDITGLKFFSKVNALECTVSVSGTLTEKKWSETVGQSPYTSVLDFCDVEDINIDEITIVWDEPEDPSEQPTEDDRIDILKQVHEWLESGQGIEEIMKTQQ